MKISIVIPAYNEAIRLGQRADAVFSEIEKTLKNAGLEHEIIVVNDGSKDNSSEVFSKHTPRIKFIDYKVNRGKGFALLTGIKEATGDYIYIADADFSTPIPEIMNFIKKMDEGFDCVIGSRTNPDSKVEVSFIRKLAGNAGNLAIRLILGLNFKDTQCGFKMFNQNAKQYFLMCKNERWGYDFEFLYLLRIHGLKTEEIPVSWKNETNDSRVKFSHYFYTLWELVKVRKNHKLISSK